MASFGKKILSAFVEVAEEENPVTIRVEQQHYSTPTAAAKEVNASTADKFRQYFDKLFKDANLPGPDYFEFSKMTEAMQAIPDEKARYSAAFAGLSVQGLDKNKLLNTAAEYLKLLEQDAVNFNSTVDAALKEKVEARQQEIRNKEQRIDQLNKEIIELQHQVQLLHAEVKENEAKIESNTGGYKVCSHNMNQQIVADIEKIKRYIS